MELLTNLNHEYCHNIKVVATDFDGTVTDQGILPANAIEALLRLQTTGIAVIIVTGRSAGWVNALRYYLPIRGAIAENGGLYYAEAQSWPRFLVPITSITEHRHQLATQFQQLASQFPQIQESTDNPFRFTDWTFNVAGLSTSNLKQLATTCQQQGWGFTYSSVQCHIKLPEQTKAQALKTVLQQDYPNLEKQQVLTVGDSPNDESLFNSDWFPLSVGVANIANYREQLTHLPQYITQAAEGKGFYELAKYLVSDS